MRKECTQEGNLVIMGEIFKVYQASSSRSAHYQGKAQEKVQQQEFMIIMRRRRICKLK